MEISETSLKVQGVEVERDPSGRAVTRVLPVVTGSVIPRDSLHCLRHAAYTEVTVAVTDTQSERPVLHDRDFRGQ